MAGKRGRWSGDERMPSEEVVYDKRGKSKYAVQSQVGRLPRRGLNNSASRLGWAAPIVHHRVAPPLPLVVLDLGQFTSQDAAGASMSTRSRPRRETFSFRLVVVCVGCIKMHPCHAAWVWSGGDEDGVKARKEGRKKDQDRAHASLYAQGQRMAGWRV